MEHFCKKEKEIDKLYKVVIDGNGNPPLVQIITEMSGKLDIYMQRQEDLIREYGITNMEFHEFRERVKTTHTEQLRSEDRGRWRTGIFVSVLCVILAGFIGWMVKESGNLKQVKSEVRDLTPSFPRGVTKPVEIPKK
jgi:thiaminase